MIDQDEWIRKKGSCKYWQGLGIQNNNCDKPRIPSPEPQSLLKLKVIFCLECRRKWRSL